MTGRICSQMTVLLGSVFLGLCQSSWGTDVTSPLRVNASGLPPRIILRETGAGGDIPYAWEMYCGPEIYEVISPANPYGLFVLTDDGHCGINIAHATAGGPPLAHLHVGSDPDTNSATFRLGGWEFESTFDGVGGELKIGGGASITFREQTFSAPAFLLDSNGSVGLGTETPNTIGTQTGNGRWLNLRATGTNLNTGVANLVAQGNLGSQMHLVHNNAPANQRIVRFQCSSGLASFHVLNDNLTSYAIPNALTIKMSNGNVGLKVVNPVHPLQLANGAHVTAGGVWTNASSRSVKQDIEPITSQQALDTVRALQPVGYRYKNELDEKYVGFIAEDVPELVATNDRKSLAAMDVVAVLTKVVQDQERSLEAERAINAEQKKSIERLQTLLSEMNNRLQDVERTTDAKVTRSTRLETR